METFKVFLKDGRKTYLAAVNEGQAIIAGEKYGRVQSVRKATQEECAILMTSHSLPSEDDLGCV